MDCNGIAFRGLCHAVMQTGVAWISEKILQQTSDESFSLTRQVCNKSKQRGPVPNFNTSTVNFNVLPFNKCMNAVRLTPQTKLVYAMWYDCKNTSEGLHSTFKWNVTLLFQPTLEFKGERENIILPYNNPFHKMSHFLFGEVCTAVPSLQNGTEWWSKM